MMRFATVSLSTLVLLSAGCATYDKPVPEGYSGPLATISDSGQVQSPRLVHIFELTQVDGRKLQGSHVATLVANKGRGFSQTPVVLTNHVPAKELSVTIEAATVYAAPILEFTNPTCSVKGDVKLRTEPDRRYRVSGAFTSEQCAVWIEETDTGRLVSERVAGKGLK